MNGDKKLTIHKLTRVNPAVSNQLLANQRINPPQIVLPLGNFEIVSCLIEHFSKNYHFHNRCIGNVICELLGIQKWNCPTIHSNKRLCRWCGRNLSKTISWRVRTWKNYLDNKCIVTTFHTYWRRSSCPMLWTDQTRDHALVKCCDRHICWSCMREIRMRIDVIITLLCTRDKYTFVVGSNNSVNGDNSDDNTSDDTNNDINTTYTRVIPKDIIKILIKLLRPRISLLRKMHLVEYVSIRDGVEVYCNAP